MSYSHLPIESRCEILETKGRRPVKPVHLLKRLCWSVTLAILLAAASASVAAAAPVIRVSMLKPDYVTPGKNMFMVVNVLNVGDEPLAGNLTIKYTFPAGVTAVEPEAGSSPGATCTTPSAQVEECTIETTGVPLGRTLVYKTLTSVEPSATGTLSGQVDVSGGGASNAVSVPLEFNTGPIGGFAIDSFDVGLLDSPAVQPAQAGSVPTEVDSGAELRSQAVSNFGLPFITVVSPTESMRDVIVHVPAGFVGYPPSTPARCTAAQLKEQLESEGVTGHAQVPSCPRDSQIGLALVNGGQTVPVYNLVAPLGAPAEFGFAYQGVIVKLRARLRPSDNGIDIVTSGTPSAIPISKFEVQLWGVPSDSKYDPVRAECTTLLYGAGGPLCPSSAVRSSFLRMPTSCGGPLVWRIDINSYQHPDTFQHSETTTPAVTGCEHNPFDPSLSLVPSTLAPHAASGVDTTLTMPQEPVNGVLPADIRRVTVTLPAGVAVNPSSAGGLQACSDADLRLGLEGPETCPDASKIGTVSVSTPLLDHPIGGSVFLRTQNSSDPQSGEMFRLAIEIRSDDDGIAMRLPGSLKVDPSTGQLTATFDDLPQLPINSMELHFKTGDRAPLATPSACGKYLTDVSFLGWNGATAHNFSPFVVSGCTAPQFAPAFRAGVVNPVAGASSPFGMKLTRSDSDEQFGSVASVVLPPGLTGSIASIPVRCTDAQAAAAACPAESRIGNVTVGAGVGSDPFYITDGDAYLTGPYKGAPFGLAFVVHAKAGPFDLGNVVVRGAIRVDPHTGQAIVQTDALPTILKGVPLQLRDIRASIDRPGFMLNPTNCGQMQVGATVTSTLGASAVVSNRFEVGECGKLAFKPKFTVSTSSRSSRQNGASLHVVVRSGAGQANVKSVHVVIPKTLPARLATLNHACAAAVFAANPASCPAESIVGTATAHTPILPAAMTGPAIFVSHGGAKFPDLDLVLQGEGVTVILTGNTFISKAGYTSSTFASVPDLPISRFDLVLPQGPHSALAANGDLCARSLAMPTTIDGQNGAQVTQRTKIAVTGCKPGIRVLGHSVKGTHARIRVAVPSGGMLVASGGGIERAAEHVAKAGTASIGVKLGAHDLRVLAANPHQRVNAKVRLRFTPEHGAPLTATVRLLMG
jgi:hypothetical protein